MKYFLSLFLALTLFNSVAFAQGNGNDTYTRVYLSYEVDGLDIWELPVGTSQADIETRITQFKNRCATDVPAFYSNRITSLELNPADFAITTESYTYRIRGYGDSHRCRMNASIKKRDAYQFKTVNSQSFVDTANVPAFDQCKLFRDDLDRRKNELKLFDRIIKLVWNQRNGTPYIESCYVTYTTIVAAE